LYFGSVSDPPTSGAAAPYSTRRHMQDDFDDGGEDLADLDAGGDA
jgi:hypothetical protein